MFTAKNNRRARLIQTGFLAFIIVATLVLPSVTHADSNAGTVCDFWTPSSWPMCMFQGLTAIIGGIFKAFLEVAAWFLEIVLQINANLVQTPSVQLGYSLSLSIANLGFVMGIIIVALATILRSQTYGIKQILWKLIFAAILVNFGLVIGGILINFADNLTKYFMNAMSGGSLGNFSSNFGAAFAPQVAAGGQSGGTSAADALGQIVATLVSVFMTIAAIFSIMALAIMLLIRYVYLGILLVIMPLAWLMWIFPNFKHLWSKWWSNFFKWTFFGPIAMFFIYLALYVWQNRANFIDNQINAAGAQSGSVVQAFGANSSLSTAQAFFSNLSTILGEQLIIFGLMLGGLFAANSMSIHGANVAMGMVKSGGNAVKGYAMRRGRQLATAPLRSQTGKAVATKLQQPHAANLRGTLEAKGLKKTGWIAEKALKYSGLELATQKIGQAVQGAQVKGAEGSIDEAKKRTSGLTKEQVINRMASAEGPYTRMALLEKASKENYLKEIPNLERYVGKDKEEEFKRYNQKDLFEKLRDKSDLTMIDLQKRESELAGKAGTMPTREEAVQKLSPEEAAVYARGQSVDPQVYQTWPDADKAAYQKTRQKVDAVMRTGFTPEENDLYQKGQAEDPTAFSTWSDADKQKFYTLKAAKEASKLTPDEQKELEENRDKQIAFTRRKAAEDPAGVGEVLQSDAGVAKLLSKLKADGKPIPISLDPANLNTLRKAYLESITDDSRGLAPHNISQIFLEMAKKNSLNGFTSLIETLREKDKTLFDKLQRQLNANEKLLRWNDNNAGKGLINLRVAFDLPKAARDRQEAEEEEAVINPS